jgi:hypothetical protein
MLGAQGGNFFPKRGAEASVGAMVQQERHHACKVRTEQGGGQRNKDRGSLKTGRLGVQARHTPCWEDRTEKGKEADGGGLGGHPARQENSRHGRERKPEA